MEKTDTNHNLESVLASAVGGVDGIAERGPDHGRIPRNDRRAASGDLQRAARHRRAGAHGLLCDWGSLLSPHFTKSTTY